MPPRTKVGTTPVAAESRSSKFRRRPPSWQEQAKRKAWGKFWANVNKGAMSR